MGVFLRPLERVQEGSVDEFFSSNSLTKVKELYGLFKSISETYSIDNEEFVELFGRHEEIFRCFDTDNNLLIDGLELFSGLIVLSRNIPYADKVAFLFDLFDFNHLKSLSKTDIEFLLISCCNAVIKIYQIKNIQDENYIEEFVREEFPTDDRVNISEMLKWARKSESVATFFALVHQDCPRETSSLLSSKIYLTLDTTAGQTPSAHHYAKQEEFMLETQKLFRFEEEGELEMKGFDINPSPSWVYGIRFEDVKQFMDYSCSYGEELIFYFVGKAAVIYNVRSQRQSHYLGHQHPIISLTVKDSLCATSEYAPKPEIRIWNFQTLETVQVLKGNHVQGVHLVRFIEHGLLVSCGCQEESPIIIFHVESGQAIFSTYCCSPAVEVCLLANFTNRSSDELIVCSLYELYHFECVKSNEERLAITLNKLVLEDRPKSSKITTCCFFLINAHFKHLRQYDDRVEKFVMTGHENGSINVWNLAKREREYTFSQQLNEIVRLIPTHNHLIVVTNSSFITYYNIDIEEKEKLRIIDITQTDQQLASYDLYECIPDPHHQQLLLVTQKADVFFLSEEQHRETPSLSHFTHHKHRTSRVEHILPIFGRIRMQKLLKREHSEHLYLAVGHAIKGIDLQSHLFIREWNIGQEIVSFDVLHTKPYGLFIVAATKDNRIYAFANKSESLSRARAEGEVVSVIAHAEESPALVMVLVSTKEGILKYNIIKNVFANAYPLSRPNLCAQLSALEGGKVMLSGQNNELHALIIKEMHLQALSNTSYRTSAPLVKLHYHIPLDNRRVRLPVIVGSQAKALLAGREDGKVYFWGSFEELGNHNFMSLDLHTSAIADLSLSHDQKHLVSSGCQDQMIVQWRFAYFNEEGSATICRMREQPSQECLSDQFSLRRAQFCKFKNVKLVRSYDQHISIKGIKNDVIRRLFNTKEWRVGNRVLQLEESNLSLKINFVFGIETYNLNNNVIALANPKRFLYFVSKIIVLYYPADNEQQFYRGHQFKVTAMVLLEDKVRVASGEAAFNSAIHIWSTKTLETLRIIRTQHRWGVIELAAHHNILLSFGLKEVKLEQESKSEEAVFERNIYCYQVIDYEKGLSIAARQEKDLVHSLAINPSNPLSFASCNDGRVTFWEVRFNLILKKKVCWLNGDTPTCCLFYQPSKGEPDLLVGTCSGTLGMISRRQYWTIFRKGEKEAKRINCLLLVRRQAETLIVVASEDNLIKIYNQRLEEKFKESMLKIEPTEEGSKKVRESKGDREDRNCSVQSLSLVEGNGKEELRILLGTRNGEILELIQSRESRYGGSKGLSFKAVLFLRFNCSQDGRRVHSKVLVTQHPKMEIIATIAHDQQIIFWDTEHNKLLHVTELGSEEKRHPTAIRFSHSGDHLIVGFSNGELMFLESKMSKSLQAKVDEKYCPLNLGKAKREKDPEGQAVLNIELSEGGDIAVSYQKIVGDKSHSHIKISHLRVKDKVKSNKNEYEKILDNTSVLPCPPHLEKSFQTQSGLLFGFAAYSLSFASIDNSSKQYFLSYYQMIDEHQNRLSINLEQGEDRKYNIWELSDSIYPVTSPLGESIRWKKFFIHNAIHSSYIFHQPALALHAHRPPLPSNNNLELNEFTNMAIVDHSVLASSFNGDLHVFKLATLEGEQPGMVGKTFPAHCCKINQIELYNSPNKTVVYTTGESDECVIKWTVQRFQGLLDNEDYQEEERDLFGEVPEGFELRERVERYKKKAEVERVILRNEDFIEWFKVRCIFGRRAEQVRNNLKYDKYDRIIYSSGHAVLVIEPQTAQKQFIFIKEDPTFCLQEVSTLQISKDGELLLACHSGMPCGLLIWQLNLKVMLKRFYLRELVQILYVIISEDNARVVVYGLTMDAVGQLLMIDVENEEIMAAVTYTHKKAWQVKAMCFRPSSHDRFFTCGMESVKEWQLISGQLVNVLSYSNEDAVINTCIDFLSESLLLANDRGELVVCLQSGEVIKREEHQNMITCLSVSQSLIATGSISSEQELAQVIIWSFQNSELTVLDKISIKREPVPSPIASTKLNSPRKTKEVDVQSLSMSKSRKHSKLLIGVTKGDIYEYLFDPAPKKEGKAMEARLVPLSRFEDEERIKAMFFSNDESQLLEISENGLLRLWELGKSELSSSHHFDSPTVNMVYSSKYELVIIAFRECIRFFKATPGEDKPLVEIEENFKQVRCITHLVLGPSQKFIALGIERISDKAYIIELYEISSKYFKQKLKLQVDSPILFIDFNRPSTDKSLMLVKTTKKAELFDISLPMNISSELIAEAEWTGAGLELSSKVKGMREEHEQRFKDGLITRIIQLGSQYIFLDSYAGIYLYGEGRLLANCHLNTSSIDAVAISHSLRWLAVGSKVDRNIVLIQLPHK